MICGSFLLCFSGVSGISGVSRVSGSSGVSRVPGVSKVSRVCGVYGDFGVDGKRCEALGVVVWVKNRKRERGLGRGAPPDPGLDGAGG